MIWKIQGVLKKFTREIFMDCFFKGAQVRGKSISTWKGVHVVTFWMTTVTVFTRSPTFSLVPPNASTFVQVLNPCLDTKYANSTVKRDLLRFVPLCWPDVCGLGSAFGTQGESLCLSSFVCTWYSHSDTFWCWQQLSFLVMALHPGQASVSPVVAALRVWFPAGTRNLYLLINTICYYYNIISCMVSISRPILWGFLRALLVSFFV